MTDDFERHLRFFNVRKLHRPRDVGRTSYVVLVVLSELIVSVRL